MPLSLGSSDEIAKSVQMQLKLDNCSFERFKHERHPAPHNATSIPPLDRQDGAVYVFSLSDKYLQEHQLRDASRRVLKVGKTSGDSRLRKDHYNPLVRSSLARSLLAHRSLWSALGIGHIDTSDVKQWLEDNTDRDIIRISLADYDLFGTNLENYIKGITGPYFEGSTGKIVSVRGITSAVVTKAFLNGTTDKMP